MDSTSSSLIPLEAINGIEVFTGHKLDGLLAAIRQETATLVHDVTTPTGRREIASVAYKIARSKTVIDDAGKALVSGWKKQALEVDTARKRARDYLDALKDEVRAPLDEWEAEQARVAREAIEAEARTKAQAEAEAYAELERKEAELRAREEAVAKAEAEARAKAAAEQAEKDRQVREEAIRQAAAAKAERDAKEAIESAERQAREAKEAAIAAAAKAEHDRAEAVRQAEERARAEAEAKERARIAEAYRVQEEADRRAADVEHRKTINQAALAAFTTAGIDADTAKQVIVLIASGKIPRVVIGY